MDLLEASASEINARYSRQPTAQFREQHVLCAVSKVLIYNSRSKLNKYVKVSKCSESMLRTTKGVLIAQSRNGKEKD